MLVFVLNQAQKTNTGKIQTPVYENVREFGHQSNGGIAKAVPLFLFGKVYGELKQEAASFIFLCITVRM